MQKKKHTLLLTTEKVKPASKIDGGFVGRQVSRGGAWLTTRMALDCNNVAAP